MNEAVIFNNLREGYAPEQVKRTMTVGELIGYLTDNCDDDVMDMPIYISNDNGYTYGGITEGQFDVADLDELNK